MNHLTPPLFFFLIGDTIWAVRPRALWNDAVGWGGLDLCSWHLNDRSHQTSTAEPRYGLAHLSSPFSMELNKSFTNSDTLSFQQCKRSETAQSPPAIQRIVSSCSAWRRIPDTLEWRWPSSDFVLKGNDYRQGVKIISHLKSRAF